MSTLRNIVLGCVADRSLEASKAPRQRIHKVKFGVPLTDALKDDCLPIPLRDMLVYIAQEGVTTADLFRRPGNPNDCKIIMKRLAEGKEVNLTNYNFYTLASVIKKFLLKIPGGIFGEEIEKKLVNVLNVEQRIEQYEDFNRILGTLNTGTQQLLALLFGTWFRIVNHSEFNTMSSEAVAKSVAGSMFHSCNDDPNKIEEAVQVLQILIDDFGVANMFGRSNIQYFADMTRTGISVREKFRYDYRYPPGGSVPSITEEEFYGRLRPRTGTKESVESNIELRLPSSPPSPQSLNPEAAYRNDNLEGNPHKKLTHASSLSAPEVNKGYSPTQEHMSNAKRMYPSTSLSRFDHVRRRQLLRMKKRSNWFLGPNTSTDSSRDASDGKSSLDAMSTDVHMSDVNVSDSGMSDTLATWQRSDPWQRGDPRRLSSDGSYLSSDMDHSRDHYSHHLHPPNPQIRSTTPPRKFSSPNRLMPPDILNGNHASSSLSPSPSPTHLSVTPRHHSTPSQSSPTSVTDVDVRCFMVENWYGQSTAAAHTMGSHS